MDNGGRKKPLFAGLESLAIAHNERARRCAAKSTLRHSGGIDIITQLKNTLRPFEPWLPSRAPRLSWSRSLRLLQHEVAEVLGFLRDRGFVLADVLGLKRRPLDCATAQLDLLFLPESSSLRADRRWNG
jgi:hypothetical protein